MATLLRLVYKGTTIVDFVFGTDYKLTKWAPAVSTLRRNYTGGFPYEDVLEEMEIAVRGSSALENLAKVANLIERAGAAVQNGGLRAAADLALQMRMSGSAAYHSYILGPPAPGEPVLILPERFSDSPALDTITPVVLRFRRAGLWAKYDHSNTTSGSVVTHPTTASATITAAPYAYSPSVTMLLSMPWEERVVWNSFVLTATAPLAADAAKKIVIFDAEDMSSGGAPPIVNDSANKARGNNVLRFSFPSATMIWAAKNVSSLVYSGNRCTWHVFASVRSNSATTSFKVRPWARQYGMGVYSASVTIPADFNGQKPRWVNFGALASLSPPEHVGLEVTSSAAGSIDIDTIALLCVEDPLADRAIAILAGNVADAGALGSDEFLAIQHPPITRYGSTPVTLGSSGSGYRPQNYSGNPDIYVPPGHAGHAFAWLACGNYNTNYWRATDASGTVVALAFQRFVYPGTLSVY